MKKLIIVLISLLFIQVGIAQSVPTFSEIFSRDTTVAGYAISVASYADSIYISLFEQPVSGTNYQATTFLKTDPSGSLVMFNRFYQPEFYYASGPMQFTSDGYLLCGGGSGSLLVAEDKGTLYKFDRTTLDTVMLRYYSHGDESGFSAVTELSDGNYLFAGQAGDSSLDYAYGWLVKTDPLGDTVWQKFLYSDEYNKAVDQYSFAGGFYQPWSTGPAYTQGENPGDSAVFIDKYDNNGNFVWRDTLGNVGYDNLGGAFTGIREGGGVFIMDVLDTSGFQSGPIVIYKYDTNGSILWQHYVSYQTQLYSMIETRSGDLVICGWGGGYPIGFSADTIRRLGGCILKLDDNGNTIFFQVYEYDTTQLDQLFDITETSDGGYASVGDAFERIGNGNYQRAWLLKVDSNGCLNGNCPTLYTGIQNIPSLQEFFVFPDPATSQFTVALAGPNDIYQYHDLKFSLYDLTGRLVTEQSITAQTTIIQRGDLADGLYVWSLTDNGSQLKTGKMVFK